MQELILTDLTNDEVIYIPVLPQEFKVSYANSFGSWNILRLGEVKYQEGVELSGISWDSFFEIEALKDMAYVQSDHWLEPQALHGKLERIKIDGRPVRIMLTESPINFDCFLSSFDITFKDLNGRIYYSITWIQDKPIDVSVENADLLQNGEIMYRVHIQDQGWQDWVSMGEVAGTTGKCLRIEAIEIKSLLNNLDIIYCTHLRDIGWTDWSKNGETSGTTGEARRMEAIKIDLQGAGAPNYDVFYRLHIKDAGWLEWSKNGEVNGTTGAGTRAEAAQIVVCKKGMFFESDADFYFNQGQLDTQEFCKARPSYSDLKESYYEYTVKEHDSFWTIAGIYYGESARWREIFEANKTLVQDNPDNLRPGMVVKIPG